MQTRSLERVSVWLNDARWDESLIHQGLEWAFRLNLPLCPVITSTTRGGNGMTDQMKSLGEMCAQRGIAMDMFFSLDGRSLGIDQFLRPHSLCLFMENRASRAHEKLVAQAARNQQIALLLCPAACAPMTRFLVVLDQANLGSAHLESVGRLCQAMEVDPIMLIVAKTDRDAHLRQGYAEGICASFRLHADFDVAVDCDIRSAVRHAVSWRGCSHLIMERPATTSWWQGLHRDRLELFRDLTGSVGLLALPEATPLDVPRQIHSDRVKRFAAIQQRGYATNS